MWRNYNNSFNVPMMPQHIGNVQTYVPLSRDQAFGNIDGTQLQNLADTTSVKVEGKLTAGQIGGNGDHITVKIGGEACEIERYEVIKGKKVPVCKEKLSTYEKFLRD